MSNQSTAPGPFFRHLLWLLVFCMAALASNLPLAEYDTGWHLRTGQWVVEHHAVPWHDTFSTVGADQLWVAYSWLYGVLFYGLHSLLGGFGLLAYRTVLDTLIALALARFLGAREPRTLIAAGLTGLGIIGMYRILVGERPGLFSILFTIAILDAILSLREATPKRRIWFLPAICVLWANLHIQVVHGLFLLGLAWLAPILGYFLKLDDPEDHCKFLSPNWRKLTLLVSLCSLSLLATPYHVYLLTVILTYSRQKAAHQFFAEMHSLEFRSLPDWVVLGLYIAAWCILVKRQRLSVFPILLLLAVGWFGFQAKHDLWLTVLGSLAVLVDTRPDKQATDSSGASWSDLSWAWIPSAAMLVILAATRPHDLPSLWREEFPMNAMQAMREKNAPGPIWNSIEWGGPLIWLWPERQVTMDGRAQLHRDDRIIRYYSVLNARPGWDEDPDLLAAKSVIVPRYASLSALLERDPGFEILYEDDRARVFVRK